MIKISLYMFVFTTITLFSTVNAEDSSSEIFITAGKLEVFSEGEIVLKIYKGKTSEDEKFTLNKTTKCFNADEKSSSKLQEKDNFLVYKEISEVPCSTLFTRKMISIYHLENQSTALAIRDNGIPRIPIFGFGASASPITNKDGGVVVMQMEGTVNSYDADPVLHQLRED